ncbi:hypothetical protein M8997_021065 [Phyllobacterium sp. 21LDTY02-6]|uniref:hypothetical protein n=1 Tax=Phyllobacterium sp. 21LDTY02-6 TaxID=2944903 RepID=UPI00202059F6|nr:hypothetical protein [Phyllobacterium sp. 21LDTY02-6]MCO4319683.1 hypothetical protein [Phyllobacterium sp. 21LDTY02-6]
MPNSRFFGAVAALIVLCAGTDAASAASPAGRYCGEVISSGDYQDVLTSLNVEIDGRISGTYKLDGPNGRTDGTLAEQEAGSAGERTLVWTDKFGTGLLRLRFLGDFEGFKGVWGGSRDGRFDAPAHSWTGTRCPIRPAR